MFYCTCNTIFINPGYLDYHDMTVSCHSSNCFFVSVTFFPVSFFLLLFFLLLSFRAPAGTQAHRHQMQSNRTTYSLLAKACKFLAYKSVSNFCPPSPRWGTNKMLSVRLSILPSFRLSIRHKFFHHKS